MHSCYKIDMASSSHSTLRVYSLFKKTDIFKSYQHNNDFYFKNGQMAIPLSKYFQTLCPTFRIYYYKLCLYYLFLYNHSQS